MNRWRWRSNPAGKNNNYHSTNQNKTATSSRNYFQAMSKELIPTLDSILFRGSHIRDKRTCISDCVNCLMREANFSNWTCGKGGGVFDLFYTRGLICPQGSVNNTSGGHAKKHSAAILSEGRPQFSCHSILTSSPLQDCKIPLNIFHLFFFFFLRGFELRGG